jgi:subtilisin family serine protease
MRDRYTVILAPEKEPRAFASTLISRPEDLLYTFNDPAPGFTARIRLEIAQDLCANPDVVEVDRDGYVALDDPEDFTILADEGYVIGPDPSLTGESGRVRSTDLANWGLDRIDQTDLPLDGRFHATSLGRGAHVYIFDTGIRASHVEFSRVDTVASYSAISDRRGIRDCHGHGTHVAGIVAGRTWGVASASTVHVVRVLDCRGRGTVSTVQAGIDWLLENASPPAVVNMSFGMRRVGEASARLDASIRELGERGFIVVAAAGNKRRDACTLTPAFLETVITVGGIDENDRLWPKSGIGPCVKVYAPSTRIVSAWFESNTGRARKNGTSMAAGLVSGAIAAMLERDPHISQAAIQASVFRRGVASSERPTPLIFLPLPERVPASQVAP